jgi:glutamyl-tRNA synthetase
MAMPNPFKPISIPVKSRIAPTPSGYLHEGNLLSFAFTRLLTDAYHGQLLLRIDDVDAERVRPAYIEDIFHSLKKFGLHWEKGPVSPEDFAQMWSQQHALHRYKHALDRLAESNLVYACHCSRQQRFAGTPCHCLQEFLPLNTPDAAWRIQVPAGTHITWHDGLLGEVQIDLSATMGDFVVRRKNQWPAYQVASLSDDLHYGINLVVRGEDLANSTAAQLYLSHCLHLPSFADTLFFHHPLLYNSAGQKLSKSAGHAAAVIAPFISYEMLLSCVGSGIEDPRLLFDGLMRCFQQKKEP